MIMLLFSSSEPCFQSQEYVLPATISSHTRIQTVILELLKIISEDLNVPK
jgi:hypothetical protein